MTRKPGKPPKRPRGRPPEPGSSRNGATRVTAFVSEAHAAQLAAICDTAELTHGQFLAWAIAEWRRTGRKPVPHPPCAHCGHEGPHVMVNAGASSPLLYECIECGERTRVA